MIDYILKQKTIINFTRRHYPKFLKAWRDMNGEIHINPFAGMSFILKHIL